MNTGRGWSMRRRLLLWLVVPLLLLCGFLLVQSFFSARQAADTAYDRLLQASALAIAERVTMLDDTIDVDLPYAALEMLASTAQDRVFYRITDPQGNFVTGYRDLPLIAKQNTALSTPRFYNAAYHDEAIRIVLLTKPVSSGQVMIEVAQTRAERSLLTWELTLNTAWRLLLLVVVAGGLIWQGVQRNLAPLAALRQELRQRSARDLHPLESPAPQEIAPLVTAVNQMMARLEHSLGGMQRFIADATHQLRTPLAVLHTQAELALREREHSASQFALQALLDATRRATRLANQLLDHARASSDISTLDLATVDLSKLASEITAELVPLALRRDIDLGLEAEPAMCIQGDSVLLGELLKNLIDNAIRYCPNGVRITVRVYPELKRGAALGRVCLAVEDNGPGIAPSERERVFDRFYRCSSSDSGGSGLGLAIVKEIVQAHGGHVSLTAGAGGKGLLVRVILPTA